MNVEKKEDIYMSWFDHPKHYGGPTKNEPRDGDSELQEIPTVMDRAATTSREPPPFSPKPPPELCYRRRGTAEGSRGESDGTP